MKVRTLINVVPFEEDIRYKRITYEQVKKSCGKSGCTTCHGTRLAHGPYWQLVEWDEKGKKKRTRKTKARLHKTGCFYLAPLVELN